MVHIWPDVRWKSIWKIVSKQLKNVKNFFENSKNLLSLKHILALPTPTRGQICTVYELQPSAFEIFQIEHPVLHFKKFWKRRLRNTTF